MPAAVLIARFRRFYPADVWRASHYRTRSRVIPFGLFWIYYGAMRSVQALERVQFTRGAASAIGMAFANKDGGLPDTLTGELREAYLLPDDGGDRRRA